MRNDAQLQYNRYVPQSFLNLKDISFAASRSDYIGVRINMEKPWAWEKLRLQSWQKLDFRIDDNIKSPCILCKAAVIPGIGYCVLFTDFSQIWWHAAIETSYSNMFKKFNNNMTYAGSKLKDFIEKKATQFVTGSGIYWTGTSG